MICDTRASHVLIVLLVFGVTGQSLLEPIPFLNLLLDLVF
jgi:hypothetical protein